MANIRALLLDIEGTTTAIDFVYQVLFPYARSRVESFLNESTDREDIHSDIEMLYSEYQKEESSTEHLPGWDLKTRKVDGAVDYLHWLMDQDRKSTALKSIQGKIWLNGYKDSEIKGHVYPDVPKAFEQWQSAGKKIYIFSSGSVLAQKLLFCGSEFGDLSPFISGYFDTTTGPKREAKSYRKIADAIGSKAGEILFVSDVEAELDAAKEAGFQTTLSIRPGVSAVPSGIHAVINDFSELPC